MKTAREIIARAYDREQAAQMGEPDPWQDGTDHPEWQGSLGCADVAIAALAAEGFSIVETGRDPVTIEACIRAVNAQRPVPEYEGDEWEGGQQSAFNMALDSLAALSRSTREGKT